MGFLRVPGLHSDKTETQNVVGECGLTFISPTPFYLFHPTIGSMAKSDITREEGLHLSTNRESDGTGMVTLVVTIDVELLKIIEEKLQFVTGHLDLFHNNGTTFSMVDQNLTVLPENIEKVSATLRGINLSENRIRNLPKIVADFKELRILNVERNQICHIDETWGRLLTQLTHLKMSSNRITAIPNSFQSLTFLREVHLASNQVSSFPLEFCGLTQLALLDLSNNCITAIPQEISSLQALELNMNDNKISSIHRDISHCPRLQILRLEQNHLTLEAFPSSILRESKVSLLYLDRNDIDKKALVRLEEWDIYMQRYTAVKKKTDFRSDA